MLSKEIDSLESIFLLFYSWQNQVGVSATSETFDSNKFS